MELIRDIDIVDSQQKIVKHLVASAKENGIKVIAEGIESQAEAECLLDLDVDFLQGYYFGRPELKTPPDCKKKGLNHNAIGDAKIRVILLRNTPNG